MADKYKLLQKLKNGLNNVRPNQLEKTMKLWGFESKSTGHGFKFTHPDIVGPLCIATHKEKGQENKIFKPYVVQCIKAIEEIKLLEEDRNAK